MAGSKGFVCLLLLGMFVTNMNAAVSPQMITEGSNLFKELINDLKSGVKNLFVADRLTNVAKSLATLNIHMKAEQEKALKEIVKVNTDCVVAIDAAKLVVERLENICTVVLVYLNSDKNQQMMNGAIKSYITNCDKLETPIADAVNKLSKAATNSVLLEGQLNMLDTWANVKKAEIASMTAAEIAKARAEAYGSAAICVAWGPLAIIACPIAYAIAGGVTEAVNVKQIEEAFDKGIQEIGKMRAEMKAIGDQTEQLVKKAGSDKKKLQKIQKKLHSAVIHGGQVLVEYKLFFDIFKRKVTELLQQCENFQANSLYMLLK